MRSDVAFEDEGDDDELPDEEEEEEDDDLDSPADELDSLGLDDIIGDVSALTAGPPFTGNRAEGRRLQPVSPPTTLLV